MTSARIMTPHPPPTLADTAQTYVHRRMISLVAAIVLPLVILTAPTTSAATVDEESSATAASVVEATAFKTQFGTTLYTGSGGSREDAMRRQTDAYGPLAVVRLFYSGMPASWSSILSAVGKTPVVVSFNPSPGDVLSGRLDSQLSQWFRQAPTDRITRWVYWHEPEDDAARSNLNLSNYRAAWQRLARLADQAQNARLSATLVLMCWTLEPNSNRNWRDYYAGDAVIDGFGFDCYNGGHRNGKYRAVDELFGHASQLSRQTGKPWGVSEMGSVVVSGDNGQGRARWLNDAANYLRQNGARFASYFDSDVGTDYRLKDTYSRQAWRNAVQSSF